MKSLATLLLVLTLLLGSWAQDKPRVFVQGKGSENLVTSGSGGGGRHWGAWGSNSTLDSHDESMEVTKDLQKDCSGVTVTLNQSNADYTVMLNRESKHNRGLLRTNSQLQVANRVGDILGTNATRTVGNAAKGACQLIVADWQAHGRVNAPASGSSTTLATPTATPATIPAATQNQPDQAQPSLQVQQVVAPSSKPDQPEPSSAGSTVAGSAIKDGNSPSPADAARREKRHKACLELAKDNPSITCK